MTLSAVIASLNGGATYAVVGWLVASRRSDNPIGWVFLGIGLSQAVEGLAALGTTYGFVIVPGSLPLADLLSWVGVWAWVPGFMLLVTFSLLLFPDGRVPSPRWRPVTWLSMVTMALLGIPVAIVSWPLRGVTLARGSLDGLGGAVNVAQQIQFIGILLIPVVALASVASLVTRFRRSVGQERQQLKWFTYAAIPEIGVLVVVGAGFVTTPPGITLLVALFIVPLLPIAIGIAVLRYRLYDLDRLISRTVSWAIVTGVLVTAFVALVLSLQAVLTPITAEDTLAVAASTLVVAALFQPLRRRVQRLIDRRFNRSRCDAEQIVAGLANRLREATDLGAIGTDVVNAVDRSLRPAHRALWVSRTAE